MLGNLSDKFENVLRKLSGEAEISEANVRESMGTVREALLEADVHYEVVEDFCARVLKDALGAEVLKAVEPGQQMIKVVHDELVRTMGGTEADIDVDEQDGLPVVEPPLMFVEPGPTVIMMAGLQGSGKTTTCGKLAARLKKQGKRVLLAAVDLQRPAAVTQLKVLADQVQAEVEGDGEVGFYGEPDKCAEYGQAVGVAVDVAKRALKHAKNEKFDVIILDTAGRLHINDDLMGELRKVNITTQPQNVLLVIDAMTGQDAVNSAKAFNDSLEIDGVILTKFDSDTRGGAALSVRQITGKPIKFIGVGEKIDALEEFHPRRIAGRILGMGDVVSLVEKAQEQVSEEEALQLQAKMEKGQLTMDDFLSQLKKIRRMGSMKSLLGMLPGVGSQLKDLDLDDSQMNRTEAIIQSMTMAERTKPALLDNSRRRRISRGSGSGPNEVSKLVKGFDMINQMSQMMSGPGAMGRMQAAQQMASASGRAAMGGMGGGMPGMPGMGKKGTKHNQKAGGFKKRKKRR